MPCGYMGCATISNKVLWAVITVLVVLSAILLGVGIARTLPCSRQRTACIRQLAGSPKEQELCSVSYRGCARSHLITAAVGALALLVAIGVLCSMCCCSKPPGPKVPVTHDPYNMTGIQMQPGYGYPTAAPVQQHYNIYSNPYQQQQQYGAYNPHSQQQQQLQQQHAAAYTVVT